MVEKDIRKIYRNGNYDIITLSYKYILLICARFMSSSLSKLVDNLTEGIHKIKCKNCDCFLEYQSLKDDLIKLKFSNNDVN